MNNKITTWIDAEHATVEVTDGPAKGIYTVAVWDVLGGYMRLGKTIIDGQETIIKTPIADIDGYEEHEAAYRSKLQAQYDAERECNRCGKHVTKDAYHQLEWFRAGGLKGKVQTYYCDGCARLLRSIGAGEYTDMGDRAAHVPSYEPQYKGDM